MLLSIIDWSSLNDFFETLEKAGIKVSPETVKIILICSIVISVSITIFLFIKKLYLFFYNRYKRKQKTNKWRKDLIEEKLTKDYRTYIDPEQNKLKSFWSRSDNKKKRIYIETRFQDKSSQDEEDPEENKKTKDSKSLMKYYLNDILVKKNTNTFLYCVLAGSGMGKTTFAVNLLKQYINKYKEDTIPYDIYLFNLSYNTIDDIRKSINIDDKKPSRILILDALDENKDANENYKQFNDELEKFIMEYSFKAVIITCRTQFFDNEKEEPAKTTIIGDDSSDGHKYLERYDKQYISVFNDKEIRKYIKEKFPCRLNFNNRIKRKKAKEIVEKSKSLMVRPLLLSYIDDLLDEKDADLSKITNIYKILIDKWLDREVQFWKTRDNSISFDELKGKLYSFSEDLAYEMYKNRGLCISVEEMDKFLVEKLFIDNYEYKRRSLVNRDASGNIKFAHKSFLEYFLAKQMFEGKIPVSFEGMDMAETFYHELCDMEMDRLIKEGAITCYNSKEYGACFVINKAIKFYNKTHNERFRESTIFISWEAVNDVLFSWLEPLEAIRLVFFNYQNNQHNIDVLNHFLSKPMNREKTSLYFWGDIIEVFRCFDDNNFSQCKLRIINKTEINTITPKVIKQTLNSLLSKDYHKYQNWIIIDNKIYRLERKAQ